MKTLKDKNLVVLVEQLYEDLELWYPLLRLREAGASVRIAGPREGETYPGKRGYPATSEVAAGAIQPDTLDGIVIPGGYAPDHMRRHPEMIDLVRAVHEKDALVAFICHGGWVPISAGILKGKRATSFFAIKDDMTNAGVEWVDEEVVRDGNLISSRTPADLPAFCRTMLQALAES